MGPQNEGAGMQLKHTPLNKLVEDFFAGPWSRIVHKLRYVIVPLFVAWIAFSVWRASLMAPLTKMEQWVAKDQDIEIANELALKGFNQGGEIQVRLIWGDPVSTARLPPSGTPRSKASLSGTIRSTSATLKTKPDLLKCALRSHRFPSCRAKVAQPASWSILQPSSARWETSSRCPRRCSLHR